MPSSVAVPMPAVAGGLCPSPGPSVSLRAWLTWGRAPPCPQTPTRCLWQWGDTRGPALFPRATASLVLLFPAGPFVPGGFLLPFIPGGLGTLAGCVPRPAPHTSPGTAGRG